MKKFLAFLTAIAVICSSSCSKSSSDSKSESVGDTTVNPTQSAEETEISDTEKSTESTTAQKTEKSTTADDKDEKTESATTTKPQSIEKLCAVTEYREYKNDDFRNITVKASKQDTMPPVDFKVYEDIEINLSEKISSCSAPEHLTIENLEPNYKEFAEMMGISAEDYKADILAKNKVFENLSVLPDIEHVTFDGENIYYLANYDKRCVQSYGHSHSFAIFRYNPETGENTAILEYNNAEKSYQINNIRMKYHKGGLWFISNEYTISRLDLETKTVDYEKEMNGEYFNFGFYVDNSEILTVILVGTDGETTDFEYYGFDESRQELVEFEVSRENKYEDYQQFYKGRVVSTYKEDKRIVTECDHFRLETDLRVAELIGVTEKSASYLVVDAVSTIIYTYNFEKMERYTLDMTSFAKGLYFYSSEGEFYVGNRYNTYLVGNNIILNNGGHMLYVIPEIGAVFNISSQSRDEENYESLNFYNFEQSGSKMLITKRKEEYFGSFYEEAAEYYTKTNNTIEKVIMISE